ncbi:hypothetical protein Mal65_51280 [Crateriforma conspicua]|nr:hypothetical protein Mal65_51280 [Crateriforma conspicua]
MPVGRCRKDRDFRGSKRRLCEPRGASRGFRYFSNATRRRHIQSSITRFTLPQRRRVGIEERESGEGVMEDADLPSLWLDRPGGRVKC